MISFLFLAMLVCVVQCTMYIRPSNITVHHGTKICPRDYPTGFTLACDGLQGPVTFVVNGQPTHKDHTAPYSLTGEQLLRSWGAQHGSKVKVTCFGTGPLMQSTIIHITCKHDDTPKHDALNAEKERLDQRRSFHPTPHPSTTPKTDETNGIVLISLITPNKTSMKLLNGMEVCPTEYEHGFALVCQGGVHGPVHWFVNGKRVRVENLAPYSLAGDIGETLLPYNPPSTRNSTFISCHSSQGGPNYHVHVTFRCGARVQIPSSRNLTT